jgi:hypothetical protein
VRPRRVAGQTVSQRHLTAPRGEDLAVRSRLTEGRFGRMFRTLPAFAPDDAALKALARTMLEPPQPVGPNERDGAIPAGYTYLGQFIDHDITFDPVSSLQRLNDPDGLVDFRTPRLDLDSLYGDPPNDPYLYESDDDARSVPKFLIGENAAGEADLPRTRLPSSRHGLPRGRALIGDPRNDENVIVSQLHLLFLQFHNSVVDWLSANEPELDRDPFEEARRLVRWHYQWIVVHDFLNVIVGQDVIDDVLREEPYRVQGGPARRTQAQLRFYSWQRQPFMPVEFSGAAYRFGHSLIRPDYRLNSETDDILIFTDGELTDEHQDLRGFRPLPGGWTIDWSLFFEIGDDSHLQRARKIDPKLAAPLGDVPGTDTPRSLAERNLLRGRALELPSGQSVARAMGIEPLSDRDLELTDVSPAFRGHAPLWFYVLKEAELHAGGESLGPVGGRIVAEVLLGLLSGDPQSYLSIEPNWRPTLGATPGVFTMADLVSFVHGSHHPEPDHTVSGPGSWPR